MPGIYGVSEQWLLHEKEIKKEPIVKINTAIPKVTSYPQDLHSLSFLPREDNLQQRFLGRDSKSSSPTPYKTF